MTLDEYNPTEHLQNLALPILKLDPEKYREDLKALQLTHEQEDELLRTLWDIMSAFINLGWGVDSVQMVLPEIFGEANTSIDKAKELKGSSNSFNSISINTNRKDTI